MDTFNIKLDFSGHMYAFQNANILRIIAYPVSLNVSS